jgi:hypothetical protein
MKTMKRRMAAALSTMLLAGLPHSGVAVERKAFAAVSAPSVLRETQRQENNDRNVMLVWWIPYEFWQVSTANAGESQRNGIAQLEPILTPYTILMVVDGRVLPLGSMNFANREQLEANLRVEVLAANGTATPMVYVPEPPQVQAVLGAIRPMLAGNLGELGKNMQLFVYNNQGADSKLMLSPYGTGGLRVTLTPFTPPAPDGAKPLAPMPARFDFETPLDSLHVARLCANGKPAHISWKYCPWDGKKLK